MSIKTTLIDLLATVGIYKLYSTPKEMTANHIPSSPAMLESVHDSLKKNCAEFGEENIELRLNSFRKLHIPFLNHHMPLRGARVLEIGCGSGSSTVALAEQGALVTGIDVDPTYLQVGIDRAAIYGIQADFRQMNAEDICEQFPDDSFDIVVFFATMEHLTNAEKKEAIRQAWRVTRPGGIWCVLGTPNLMWHFDIHTSMLPHYFWIPDDIAFEYARFSPRQELVDSVRDRSYEDNKEMFARWGRGVSYHHIDLYIGDVTRLDVVDSLQAYVRSFQSGLQRLLYRRTLDYKFKKILQATGRKGIQLPFYENYLDVIIRKH